MASIICLSLGLPRRDLPVRHHSAKRQEIQEAERRPAIGHVDKRVNVAQVRPLDRHGATPPLRTCIADAIDAPELADDEDL